MTLQAPAAPAPSPPGADVPRRDRLRVWRLRTHLSLMMVLTISRAFALVGGATLWWRVPQLVAQTRADLHDEVEELSSPVDQLMGGRQARIEFLADLAKDAPDDAAATQSLELRLLSSVAFQAMFWVSNEGIVKAAGLSPKLQGQRSDLIGSDIASTPLFRVAIAGHGVFWGSKHLSGLTGSLVIDVPVRPRRQDHVLIGEIPLASVLASIRTPTRARPSRIWMVDGSGEVIAQTGDANDVGHLNLRNHPLIVAIREGEHPPDTFLHKGVEPMYGTAQFPPKFGWYFVRGTPAGWAHPEIRRLVLSIASMFAGCTLPGLLIAPAWAWLMARPLQGIVKHAAQTAADGETTTTWPHGLVQEFNALSDNMASRCWGAPQWRSGSGPTPTPASSSCNSARETTRSVKPR